MADWQAGPLNEALCRVYEGQMLSCIFPKGLIIGTMRSFEHKHRKNFFIMVGQQKTKLDQEPTWYSVSQILAYKVMDP